MVDVCHECGSEGIIEHWKEGDIVCVSCGLVLDHHIVDTRCEWVAFTDQDYDPPNEYDTNYSGSDGYRNASKYSSANLSSTDTTTGPDGLHTLGVGPSFHDLDSDLELNSGCGGESSSDEKYENEHWSESESESEEINDYPWDDDLASGESEDEDDEDGKELITTGDQIFHSYYRKLERLCSMTDELHGEPPAADGEILDHPVVRASYP